MLIRQAKLTPHQTEQQNCFCIIEELDKIIQISKKKGSSSEPNQ
jgi:hypothetical protein